MACFLKSSAKLAQAKAAWNDHLFSIRMDDKKKASEFGARITQAQVLQLVELATPSLVGKGNKTVHDERVRKSLEIPADRIKLAPEFLQLVSRQVRALVPSHLLHLRW